MGFIRKAPEDLDKTVIRVTQHAARLSTCRRRKVGAAVFNLNGELLGAGCNSEQPFENGVARSCLEGDCPRGMAPYATIPADSPYSDCVAVHAEIVALSVALGTEDREAWLIVAGCVMIVTHKPCHECTPILERLGMDVYYLEEM